MAKQKKKRNKSYRGSDAKNRAPSIIRVEAVNRSKSGQWLYDRRKVLKAAGIAAGVVLLIALIIVGIISLFVR